MAGIQVRSPDSPDETRAFTDKGRLDIVRLGNGMAVGCGHFEPGWRWSSHVQPIAGTPSCNTAHTGCCLSGRMRVRMDDGEEAEISSGQYFSIAPGHDAWVVGDEACVMLDFTGTDTYARPQAPPPRREATRPVVRH